VWLVEKQRWQKKIAGSYVWVLRIERQNTGNFKGSVRGVQQETSMSRMGLRFDDKRKT